MDHVLLRARWCALFALVLTSCASAEVRNARPEEEGQADEAAAHLLTVAWRTNVGCLGTADVYQDIARDRTLWGAWLSRHPSPERRVGALVNTCERELRRLR